jgi:hypothetical protein
MRNRLGALGLAAETGVEIADARVAVDVGLARRRAVHTLVDSASMTSNDGRVRDVGRRELGAIRTGRRHVHPQEAVADCAGQRAIGLKARGRDARFRRIHPLRVEIPLVRIGLRRADQRDRALGVRRVPQGDVEGVFRVGLQLDVERRIAQEPLEKRLIRRIRVDRDTHLAEHVRDGGDGAGDLGRVEEAVFAEDLAVEELTHAEVDVVDAHVQREREVLPGPVQERRDVVPGLLVLHVQRVGRVAGHAEGERAVGVDRDGRHAARAGD